MLIKPEWEEIGQGIKHKARRMKVWGGWIFEDWACGEAGDRIAVCFIPDPNYEWEIK